MSDALIKPEEIPQFTGHIDQLESDVTDLRNDAGAIAGTGAGVHSNFQGLSAFYEAPEAEQLFATTKPVADAGRTFGDDLKTVANALSTYANEIKPLASKLTQLRHDAEAFVAEAKKDHNWQYDSHKVDRNNDLRKQVDAAVAAFWDAEIRCANAIDAIFHGTQYVHNDGSNKSNMYGYTAQQMDGAKGLPWGDAAELKYHWYRIDHWAKSFVWDGLIVDGIWGTIKGLGGLVGLEGLDTFLNSWKGLGELVVGLSSYSPVFAAMPESWLPGWVRTSRKTTQAFGKSLVAWDEWSKDPARAAGGVTFNALTLLAGGEGVAAKTGSVGKVVSVLGKAGKFIDPMTYAAKGAGIALKGIGDLPKVAAAIDALKNLKDQAVFNVKGLVNIDTLKARFGSLPDGTVPLPDGGHIDPHLNYHAPDGTIHEPVHEPSAADRATPTPPDVHVEAPTQRELVTVGGGSHDPGDLSGGAHGHGDESHGSNGSSPHADVHAGSDAHSEHAPPDHAGHGDAEHAPETDHTGHDAPSVHDTGHGSGHSEWPTSQDGPLTEGHRGAGDPLPSSAEVKQALIDRKLQPVDMSRYTAEDGHYYATRVFAGGRADGQTVFAGHGFMERTAGEFTVPHGTTISFYVPHGDLLPGLNGVAVEAGVYPGGFVETFHPGDVIPDYTLAAPSAGLGGSFSVMENSVTVTERTRLSELLKEGMGDVHWAACRELEP
ncbi:putative adhesin [Streptantibioticus rubrisoli]|uniref:Putative adhesin Stv domain-containing protein n=1 Tax=Streptantibioticus rubrisoli TaxID=1387313 RepID=A0ABT1PKT4_9ACTN|nr:hypothetical protein [Streptantibioticus rubrisoli]MCQ4045977.1 hypothetical protein [Streptantibioticus rubrisoli]